jgi:starch phosphorylase
MQVKLQAKKRLASVLRGHTDFPIDPTVMFDIQSGKIHPYKRQVLHILHIIHKYLQIKKGVIPSCRRLHVFAGKASPSDFFAKQIIHLINVTIDLVNKDPEVSKLMQVIFIPNFGMTWAEHIVPAADLSEQISTASMEASSTFNMKYAFNGAYILASKSGSNVEIAEHVGAENISVFGKNSDELMNLINYRPQDLLNSDERLNNIFTLIEKKLPSVVDGSAIYPLLSSLRDSDRYFVLIDFDDYIKKQQEIDLLFSDQLSWSRKCLMNIAKIGWFSADRVIKEYANDIWKVSSL